MSQDFIIECENVKFSYAGSQAYALNGVSLKVKRGEFLSVIGHNGSGKSTFARLLNGLLEADEGKITVLGLDVSDSKNVVEIRKHVGIVFQNPDNQMVATIIEDDIAFGPENIGIEREDIIRRVDKALEAVGMSEFRRRTASKLSGGQKQRVAIAGVLAMEPQILILDESTSMLDPNGRKEIMDIALKLNKQGITVINITHNMEEAAIASRVIVLRKGRIAMDGTPKEVFASGQLEACGLTLPPVTQLSRALMDVGFEFDGVVTSEQELVEGICRVLK